MRILTLLTLCLFTSIAHAGLHGKGAIAVLLHSERDDDYKIIKRWAIPRVLTGYKYKYMKENDHNLGYDHLLGVYWKKNFTPILKNPYLTVLDIYVFGHGNSAHDWLLRDIDPELRKKIRFVYTTGCGSGDPEDLKRWIDWGAKVAVGHPGTNYPWAFLGQFNKFWKDGYTVKQAVSLANVSAHFSLLNYITVGRDGLKYLSPADIAGASNLTFREPFNLLHLW